MSLVGISLERITPAKETVKRLLDGATRHIADARVQAISAETRFASAYTAISEAAGASSALRAFRDKTEREFVLRVLRKNHGNISRSAVELGIGRTYLHRRLAALGIAKKDWLG